MYDTYPKMNEPFNTLVRCVLLHVAYSFRFTLTRTDLSVVLSESRPPRVLLSNTLAGNLSKPSILYLSTGAGWPSHEHSPLQTELPVASGRN